MKPYYSESGITIYHGDCREFFQNGTVFHLLLTDPPYGIGEDGGACRTRNAPGYSKHPKLSNWYKSRPDSYLFTTMLNRANDCVIWGGNYFADLLPPRMGWLYWQKLMGGDFSDGELAWTTRNGALREFTMCPKGIDKQHPCQKPIELMTWCMAFFPEADTILDPFMGSGTTLRAAKDLGRKAIGIEIEEKYCEIAAKRLQQEVFNFNSAPSTEPERSKL